MKWYQENQNIKIELTKPWNLTNSLILNIIFDFSRKNNNLMYVESLCGRFLKTHQFVENHWFFSDFWNMQLSKILWLCLQKLLVYEKEIIILVFYTTNHSLFYTFHVNIFKKSLFFQQITENSVIFN